MKIIAFYLPQYHEIKENNEWWGKGFTEWTNVKNAAPTFKGQNMPRVPLNNNYYDLTNVDSLIWQANLAKKYGIYGFAYYHYWSTGNMLLEKPAEIMLANKEVDIPFCFSWANHTWTRCWADKSDETLWEQKYGDESDWIKHFNYLLPFFKDDRYIKIDGKPVMIIYNPNNVPEFKEMFILWKEMALENGLKGIYFMNQENTYDMYKNPNDILFDASIEFQMNKAVRIFMKNNPVFAFERITNRIADRIPFLQNKFTTMHYTYDQIWKIILKQKPTSEKHFPGAFVDWDNTPRRKNRGQVCIGANPEKFRYYLTKQIKKAKEEYKKNYLFMFAWNEWGESGYLEPDEKYGYGMLEAVRDSLITNDEFEKDSEINE